MLLFVYIVDGIANVLHDHLPITSSVRFPSDIQSYNLPIPSRSLEIVEILERIVVSRIMLIYFRRVTVLLLFCQVVVPFPYQYNAYAVSPLVIFRGFQHIR